MTDRNIWSEEWGEQGEDWSGGGGRSKRLPRGDQMGASVYELDPGNFVVYHFHHGAEELLIVLSGRPTLRTPDGERELTEGEVVHFPVGPPGAHALSNATDGAVRFVMVSTLGTPKSSSTPTSARSRRRLALLPRPASRSGSSTT